jgi:hypothetical protein
MPALNLRTVAVGAAVVAGYLLWRKGRAQTAALPTLPPLPSLPGLPALPTLPVMFGPGPVKLNQ